MIIDAHSRKLLVKLMIKGMIKKTVEQDMVEAWCESQV